MDKTNANCLKMLEPKKYDKPKNKVPLNKLFDMKGKKICKCKKKTKCVKKSKKRY